MPLVIEQIRPPLQPDQDGVIRIGDSRVTLDTVVAHFELGATPNELVAAFPSLRLDDVYLTLGYYLRNKAAVALYLDERLRAGEQLRQQIETDFPSRVARELLLSRRQERQLRPITRETSESRTFIVMLGGVNK